MVAFQSHLQMLSMSTAWPSHGIIIWFVIFDSMDEIWNRGWDFVGRGMSLVLCWLRVIVISIKTSADCSSDSPTPDSNLQPPPDVAFTTLSAHKLLLLPVRGICTLCHSGHRPPSPARSIFFAHLVFSYILIAYRAITILHSLPSDWRYLLILDATDTDIFSIGHRSCLDPVPNLSACRPAGLPACQPLPRRMGPA